MSAATASVVHMNMPDLSQCPTVDQVGVEERAARFQTRSIKAASKMEALKLTLSMIDLTTLTGMDTPGKVKQLCHKARQLHASLPQLPGSQLPGAGLPQLPGLPGAGMPHVAAVCVYPRMVAVAKQALGGSDIHVASVATGFPTGQYPLDLRLEDVRRAVGDGADEIDMVISRGEFLRGNYNCVFDEIVVVKEACGSVHLKVILETGELATYDNVRKASDLAMHAGADFIKTSTGTTQPAATLPVTLVMLEAIRDFYHATGRKVGMKPAGGIRESKAALHYLVMVRETLGQAWLTPDRFRFGASTLANDVLMQIVKQQTGAYQSADYFSLD